jgi:hypothetical protein
VPDAAPRRDAVARHVPQGRRSGREQLGVA